MTRSDAARILSLIDLTNLSDECTESDVVTLCRRARGEHGSVAAVCVWPRFVGTAVRELANTMVHENVDARVRVATVVNFPHGTDPIEKVLADVAVCVADGADEIDLVIPFRSLSDGDVGDHAVVQMVAKVKQALPDTVSLKTILETGELGTIAAVEHASSLCIASGADFIKTSTGKTPTSASLQATGIMLQAIRETPRTVGLKPSGGIRTLADAAAYLHQADEFMGPRWATRATFRFGASGLLDALTAALSGAGEGTDDATSTEAAY
jgi:deoxyribose-phosphate aldolase